MHLRSLVVLHSVLNPTFQCKALTWAGVARQIVVLEGGRAVEFGSHTALLAAKGRYAELWARQAMLEDALGQSDEEALR